MNLLLAMPDFSNPEIWVSLLTLVFLEIVLGVDNIIFISITSNKLAEADRRKATNIGLVLAMALRVLLLFGISYIIAMQSAIFGFGEKEGGLLYGAFSGQSLILIAGGLFLLYKSTSEIHHKLEGGGADQPQGGKKRHSLGNAIVQITLINIVFSFDSILTAVGLSDNLVVMIIAVVASVLVMMLFANPVTEFVNKHPSIQMLGLAFLILIGFMLMAEGAHLAHLRIAGQEIGAVPKGYLYFAIAFSLLVEFLNMRLRKNNPVQLHGYAEEGQQ